MARLLCFIGTGNYQPCKYGLRGKESRETPYIQVALNELIPRVTTDSVEEVVVFATDKAKEKHSDPLQAEISKVAKFAIVDIPNGKSEEELWKLFQNIGDPIRENERFYLDVTHGFRSLPILVTLLLGYIDVVKQAKPTAIYYGAHEAKDENGVAPVFDLSPFVQILDWTRSVDHFTRTGDSSLAEELIKEFQKQNIRKRIAEGENPKGLPKVLKPLADEMRHFRECLTTIRARETPQEGARRLVDAINKVETKRRTF